ncbi:protein-disulfide reductase DsbD domain-containing protein, partial [Sandarakinorhabdus rubra]|uniref:protein-disulfide reductase DsbD domain-containing protein n=1 Tax=Sandarakinorhabdus rubra TaxID=2672568 RepID=UPI0022A78204
MIRRLLLALALLLAPPALAQSFSDQPNTRVELIAQSARPAPGTTVQLGIELTPKKGWHTYWLNPGDAGAPTRVEWTLPPGVATPPELQYPVPGTLVVSGLMNHVYEKTNILTTSVNVPAGVAPGSEFPITVKVDWLVCSFEQCVPENATLTLPLVIGDGAADPDMGARLTAAREALPKPLLATASWAKQGNRFVLAVPLAGLERVKSAWFFPAGDMVINHVTPQQVTRAGDALRIETDANAPEGTVNGVLRVEMTDGAVLGFAIAAGEGTVPAAGAALAAGSGEADDAGSGG